MSTDWRELLDRVLDGETLSEAEARALAEALEDESAGRLATRWLAFESQLQLGLAAKAGEGVALSRERLLAEAALREKALEMRRAEARRALRRKLAAAAAVAAAVLAAVLGWLLAGGRAGKPRVPVTPAVVETYPAPDLAGDFQIVQARGRRDAAVHRGDRVIAGRGGARLRLGGYCNLTLEPGADVVLRGERGKEAVELEGGKVVSSITERKGGFRVGTPLGSLRVAGTEFVTTVEYLGLEKGETDVAKLKKAAFVTVVVLAGSVAYEFGEEMGLLSAGGTKAFAGGERVAALPAGVRGFKGMIVGRLVSRTETDLVLKVTKIPLVWKQSRADDPDSMIGEKVTVSVWRKSRLFEQQVRALREMKEGDEILVEAFQIEGDRLTIMEVLRKAEASSAAFAEGGEGERREKREGRVGEGEGERPVKREGREGEGDRPVKREGEGERPVKREGREGEGDRPVKREGEGERPVKREGREGEGDRPVKREGRDGEGEGERREKREPKEGAEEGGKEVVLRGILKAAGEGEGARGVAALLRVKEKVGGEGERGEREVVYRIKNDDNGEKLSKEANGWHVIVVGTVEGEGDHRRVVVKKFRALEAAAGEGERRETKERGEGEGREGKERKEWGEEGERREKKERRDGEGEGREKKIREGGDERKGEVRREGGDAPAWREEISGFRGMLEGTLVGKTEEALILKVEKVSKAWTTSTAKKPESLVGKTVKVTVSQEPRAGEALLKAMGEVRAGDKVLLGASHAEGDRFSLVEILRKIHAE
jgi:hypothetical protein